MRRFFQRRKKDRERLVDSLAPRGSTLQIILKRNGIPEAAIYKDDETEIRSPSLQDQDNDESIDHNP